MNKIRIHSEISYILSILIMSFSVAMVSAADFGVSMIVAPAYILSQKLSFLTFGQSEYIIQALLFIVFCLLLRKVKPVFFCSFLTCILYGAALDFWRWVIPIFNPDITVPGSMSMVLRIVFFVLGMVMTAFAVAMSFHTYLYPQVYDFFVKGVTAHFDLNRTKFKYFFDGGCLFVACAMTLMFFGKFVGVGIGTIILTLLNGFLIGIFDKILTTKFEFVPFFQKLEPAFDF